MAIFRNAYETNFTVLSNELLGNPDLSWKAKGVLAYLLSLPPDWVIYADEIEKHSSSGRDATASAIKELIKYKYIERTKVRGARGQFKGYEYCVYSVPTENGKPVNGESVIGKSVNGKPATTNNLSYKKMNYKKTTNKSTFNNFEAREYDYEDLEKKLLGWSD